VLFGSRTSRGALDRILDWRNPHELIIHQRHISWLTSVILKTGKVDGGKRPGAGRPKGSVNRDRAEQRHIAERKPTQPRKSDRRAADHPKVGVYFYNATSASTKTTGDGEAAKPARKAPRAKR
jgi:hypothetical protein